MILLTKIRLELKANIIHCLFTHMHESHLNTGILHFGAKRNYSVTEPKKKSCLPRANDGG